jgi:antitoxin CptB
MDFVNDNRAPIENRRKKLTFRAWHRGMKEMDIILGNYADRNLSTFDEAALDEFEALLHVPDQALYSVLVQGAPVPEEDDTELLRDIMNFAKDPLGKR